MLAQVFVSLSPPLLGPITRSISPPYNHLWTQRTSFLYVQMDQSTCRHLPFTNYGSVAWVLLSQYHRKLVYSYVILLGHREGNCGNRYVVISITSECNAPFNASHAEGGSGRVLRNILRFGSCAQR